MSKKSKTLIIVLGVLLLLAGGYYGATIREKRKAAPDSSAYTPPPRLGNLNSSELVKIEGPGITIEKNGESWELTYLPEGIPPGGIELDAGLIQYLTYSLATIWAESIVDEAPENLSVYGLDNPSSRAAVTDSAGQKAAYILGDITPTRTAYYLMEEGDLKVYAVATYVADYMKNFLDSIRKRSLFPAIELSMMTRLRIESGETKMLFEPRDDSQSLLIAPFSYFVLSHYRNPRGADSEALNKLIVPFSNLEIADFIDDAPSSLIPYGLDKPVMVSLETQLGSLDLLIGNEFNGKRYAKLAAAPGVFTLNGMAGIINAKPFTLLDKFALIINIDLVSRLSITGGEKDLTADFRGTGDEGVYFLNGKKTVLKSFRSFYQAVIGLLVDAEIPAGTGSALNPGAPDSGNITIEYQLNTAQGERASITLIPYNRDFYALLQDGATEFLISRSQVRKIYEAADAMEYEE